MANPQVDPRKIRSLISGPWRVWRMWRWWFPSSASMAKDVNEVLASRLVNEQVSIRLEGIKKIRFPWTKSTFQKRNQSPIGRKFRYQILQVIIDVGSFTFIQLSNDYNSLFVDSIHFSTCAQLSGEERSEARWRWAQGQRVFLVAW